MKSILLYIWQLPQNLCGVIYKTICRPKYKHCIGGVNIYETTSLNGSVSLGNYVFLSKFAHDKRLTLKHELGHAVQSQWLGPLYLFVIRIPSICWVIYRRRFCRKTNYYWFYTESWANRIMDIHL